MNRDPAAAAFFNSSGNVAKAANMSAK